MGKKIPIFSILHKKNPLGFHHIGNFTTLYYSRLLEAIPHANGLVCNVVVY